MKPYSFLFLSDIHFGSFSDYADFNLPTKPPAHALSNSAPVVDSLIKIVREMDIPLESIIIPGDLTSTACPNEFIGCRKVVEKIADSLGVNKDRLFYTYGNHDTSWRISKLAVGDSAINPDPYYNDVAGSIAEVFLNKSPDVAKGPLIGSGYFKDDMIDLVLVNSGYYSTHDQDQKRGQIGRLQMEWIRDILNKIESNDKWKIFIIHHHIYNYKYPVLFSDKSFVDEDADLLEIIGNSKIDIVCHGHRHHPYLDTTTHTNWNHKVTFFCGGSVAVNTRHRLDGEIPNLFHIVTLEDRLKDGTAIGTIRTFQYSSSSGWIPSYAKDIPFDSTQKFGAYATDSILKSIAQGFLQGMRNSEKSRIQLPSLDKFPIELQCVTQDKRLKFLEEEAGISNFDILTKGEVMYLVSQT